MGPNNITNPKHYQFSKPCNEVRDVIKDRNEALSKTKFNNPNLYYDYDNFLKYGMRWFEKNGTEDLRKAKYCLDSMLSILEDGKDSTDQSTECKSSDDVSALDLSYLRQAIDEYHKSNIIGVYNIPCQPL